MTFCCRRSLILNPTFIFMVLAGVGDEALIAGFVAFGPKYMQNQFSMSAATAGMIFGGSLRLPGSLAGRCPQQSVNSSAAISLCSSVFCSVGPFLAVRAPVPRYRFVLSTFLTFVVLVFVFCHPTKHPVSCFCC